MSQVNRFSYPICYQNISSKSKILFWFRIAVIVCVCIISKVTTSELKKKYFCKLR